MKREMRHPNFARNAALSIATLAGVFAGDCLAPLGVPVYLAYVVPIFFAVQVGRKTAMIAAALCSAFTFAGLYLSPGSYIPFPIAVVNRGVAVIMLCSLAAVEIYRSSLDAIRRQFALVVDNARDIGTIALASDGTVTDWNKGAEQLFGYRADEIVGKPGDVLFTVEDREHRVPDQEMEAALKTGRGIDDRWQLRKDGSRFWANGVVLPLEDRPGTGFIKIIRDMTERRRLMDELGFRLEELERSNKDLEQFSYIAAHDLKAPLRTIGTFSDLLRKAIADGDQQKIDRHLASITDGAHRMRALIDDLLAYAKAGGVALRREPVPLAVAVEEAKMNLRSAIRDSGAVIEDDGLPVISADRSQMVQLLQNLIGNAIKYRSERPPVIRIDASGDGIGWEIRVTDNGAGVEAGNEEKIFEPFHRASTAEGGSGIGLAICRRIAERHGGRISVSPSPGGGSTFRIILPERRANTA